MKGAKETRTGPAAVDAARAARLREAAERALAEARERRLSAGCAPALPKEINGRGGPEPVRYGDWEVKGIATDF
ncbi:MAG TPA: DUF1674 domain-containing protein [Methylocella sp.]|nr:DUF1674 domain-containing protein [Methylocella sp.]